MTTYPPQLPYETIYQNSEEFDATLQFDRWEKSRSTSKLIFTILDGPFVDYDDIQMTMSEFARVLYTQSITQGVVTGRWTVYKKGDTYSVGLA